MVWLFLLLCFVNLKLSIYHINLNWILQSLCFYGCHNVITFNADMQWRTSQDLAADNYMMPMGPGPYNPYWNGMQPGMGMEGYMAPYGGPMPYMGYGLGPLDMPFGGFGPQDSFGAQGYMMPLVPPQRYTFVSFEFLSLSLVLSSPLSPLYRYLCFLLCMQSMVLPPGVIFVEKVGLQV